MRDPSIQPQLDTLSWYVYDRSLPGRKTDERTGTALANLLHHTKKIAGRQHTGSRGDPVRLRTFASLGSKAKIRFVAPTSATLMPDGVQREIFLHSPSFPARQKGLGRLVFQHPPQLFDIQLADAVALAGMMAHASRSRRAVLLLLGPGSIDTSRYATANVRHYLRELGVPLYVARFSGDGPDPEWGEVLNLGDLAKPAEAERQSQRVFADLAKDLENQRLVWLIGRHLPQHVELGSAAVGMRLAGR